MSTPFWYTNPSMNETWKKYVTFFASVVLFFILLNALNISIPITMTTTSRSSELAVVGEGKIDVLPDTAYVDAGIYVTGVKTVAEAQNAINTVNNTILSEMKNLGIKKEDIKTSNYSINPDYNYESGKNQIKGYNGNATTSIKVTKLDLVSRVIEKATSAGANQVQGARFTVDNPDTYREKVRDMAIDNAKEQATRLSKNLGIHLGRITNIVESSPNTPIYSFMEKASPVGMGGGDMRATIEPGTQTLTSTVTLYFEKK